MVGSCTTLSKSKGKQPVVCPGESDGEPSFDLKEILSKSKGVYQHTRILTGTIALVNYSALARGVDMNGAHPAIAKSRASNSSHTWRTLSGKWPSYSKSRPKFRGNSSV